MANCIYQEAQGKKFCSLECKTVAYSQPKTKEKKRRKGVNAGLIEDAVKARKLGMNYGQYRAMLYASAHPIQRKRCT